jgi:hypothetical protein
MTDNITPATTDAAPRRIAIPGDTLVPDQVFLASVCNGASRRTGARYDARGLPFVMVNGEKWRPLEEGRKWLATQIVRKSRRRRQS